MEDFIAGWNKQKNGNIEDALVFYEKAVGQNHSLTKIHLNLLYLYGQGTQVDHSKVKDFDELIRNTDELDHLIDCYMEKEDDPVFQSNIAFLYCKQEKYEEAYKWASKNDYIGSYMTLTYLYTYGYGVTQDLTTAFTFTKLAAEEGHRVAQTNLGSMYFHGKGTNVNYEEARKWYALAASQDHPYAQFMMGVFSEKGLGMEMDMEAAILWYGRSSKQGNVFAKITLLQHYANTDPAKAVDLIYTFDKESSDSHQNQNAMDQFKTVLKISFETIVKSILNKENIDNSCFSEMIRVLFPDNDRYNSPPFKNWLVDVLTQKNCSQGDIDQWFDYLL